MTLKDGWLDEYQVDGHINGSYVRRAVCQVCGTQFLTCQRDSTRLADLKTQHRVTCIVPPENCGNTRCVDCYPSQRKLLSVVR